MIAGDRISGVVSRLKREDCARTKHDREFSKWQILIGPSDWEDYSLGKEGVEKYRVHNLPKDSGPGVYELGIAVVRTSFGRDIERLDSDQIVAVYLGQADNVRTRLQHYGRSGSHLGNASSTGPTMLGGLHKGPGLFEDILSRGFPIVFRWATMQSKSEALKTETRLLNTFDYGWNAADNGARRPDDIIQKLKKISSSSTDFSNFARKFVSFGRKQVGIRITKPSSSLDEESRGNIFSRVFKFGRSQPRLVQARSVIIKDNAGICGVVLGHGLVCQTPPVKGRKRCSDHKGMRIKGSAQIQTVREDYISRQESFGDSICGFILANGSPCQSQPVKENKRCLEHKGKRISKPKSVLGLSGSEARAQSFPNGKCETVCGVILGDDGLICTKKPVVGRVRCEEHKGFRVDRFTSKLAKGKQALVLVEE